jgi:hypothetical protein
VEVEVAARRERKVDLVINDRVAAVLLSAREQLEPDAPACHVEEGCLAAVSDARERGNSATQEEWTHPGVARRNAVPVRRIGVPKMYMRAIRMYSGNVLLYRRTNQKSLLMSLMKVLTVSSWSTSTSILVAETRDILER